MYLFKKRKKEIVRIAKREELFKVEGTQVTIRTFFT